MATAEELLALSVGSENKVCVIDNDLRTINIPKAITALGVESDDDVHRLHFRMPRYIGDIDLSTFVIRINYLNANNEGDIYMVTDKKSTNETITFSWLVGRHAFIYKGNVNFIVCMVEVDPDGGEVQREYNTTVATLPVLEGLEVEHSEPISGELIDILAQLPALKADALDSIEAVMWDSIYEIEDAAEVEKNGVTEHANYLKSTFGDDYDTTVKQYRTRATAITKTVEGDNIIVNDASDDRIRSLKIFGKSTQAMTPSPDYPQNIESIERPVINVNGINLFDFDGITDTGTITRNPDGSLTITLYASTTGKKLRDLAPSLKAGNKYSIHIDTESTNRFIYLSNTKSTWHDGSTTIVTEDMLDSTVVIYGVNGDAPTIIRNIAITPSGVAYHNEPYLPIQTVALNKNLSGVPVSEGGNYTDENGQQWICDEVDFERGVYIQRILVQTITGRESWTVNPLAGSLGTVAYHIYNSTGDAEFAVGLCSHFANGGQWSNGLSSKTNTFWVANVSTTVFKTDGVQSLEDFVAFLRSEYEAGNPVTLYSAIRTPIETPLTSAELAAYNVLHTNYPNTVVQNSAGAHMELTYNADTKTYLENCFRPTDEQVQAAVEKYLRENSI